MEHDESKPEDAARQLLVLINAHAEALTKFVEKTERHLRKIDCRLDKHWEAISELENDTSNLDDSISELDQRKLDAPDQRELRIAAENKELERIEKEESERRTAMQLQDISDRLDALEDAPDADDGSIDEEVQKLADTLASLEKFVRLRLR
jgi:chromosome segregation ATPase